MTMIIRFFYKKKPSNKLMKRLSLYIFLILFSLQTPSQADDIRDFQIEGMSIGDSLLDYFSEEEINKRNIFYYPKSKKFAGISFGDQSFYQVYESVQFSYDPKNKKIYGISGKIHYPNNIKDCFTKKDEIVSELSEIFKDTAEIRDVGTFKHSFDKSGKSTVTSIYFEFDSGGSIKVQCHDWSKDMVYEDKLLVSIDHVKFRKFLREEAY